VSELPKGWVLKPLGDYAFVKNGFAFKSKDYISPTNTSMPIIRISDIYGNIASDEKATHVDKSKIQKGFEVHKGDFLIAMSGATTGKTGVYTSHNLAYQNQRVGNIKLISNNLGCDSYKNYSILAVKDKILENAYGAAQPNISGKSLEALLLPIAPLNEQIRIANKLDSLLGKLEATQKRLDKIPTLLKRFRQSVLAAAVSGELTAEWRNKKKLN
jgi:type I restriction enzyme S subunit